MTAKKNVFAQAARDAKDGMEAVMTGEKKHAGKARAEYHTTGVRLPSDLWRECQLHRIETGEASTRSRCERSRLPLRTRSRP